MRLAHRKITGINWLHHSVLVLCASQFAFLSVYADPVLCICSDGCVCLENRVQNECNCKAEDHCADPAVCVTCCCSQAVISGGDESREDCHRVSLNTKLESKPVVPVRQLIGGRHLQVVELPEPRLIHSTDVSAVARPPDLSLLIVASMVMLA